MRFMAERMEARSTTAGTPVKSWSSTREGMNGISRFGRSVGLQRAAASTSSSFTSVPSQLRSTHSMRTRIE